jgi:uncharacterized protein YdiU (UPF0061 family)
MATNVLDKKSKQKLVLNFDNAIVRELPLDRIEYNNNPRIVYGALYSRVRPTPVKNPRIVAISRKALKLIDMDKNQIMGQDFVEYFAGNKIIPGSDPISHCYCGHQFGKFAGQLGDGRAITLGETINNRGYRWELQLKGAGKTPYSRQADGRAVLRSSIREFLCSEAMHSLGIPTTRAGSIITSNTKVIRDALYDGHTKEEQCTILLRLAPSFIRFGSFEITASTGPSPSMYDLSSYLLNYLLKYHYTDINRQPINIKAKYQLLFREIVLRTAKMVAQWQCMGFCHGVLNTDNMSILGLTIDYGPFGFMEKFDPKFICNHSDKEGRYSYENQPKVCHWNLTKLAEALEYVLPYQVIKMELEKFWPIFYAHYSAIMHRKLGLVNTNTNNDPELFSSLFETMYVTGADFTNTFRTLSLVDPQTDMRESLYALLDHCLIDSSRGIYESNRINDSLHKLLNKTNNTNSNENKLIDDTKMKNCEIWSKWLDRYKHRLQYDLEYFVNLPGTELNINRTDEWKNFRIKIMNTTNPKYVLRNWMAQEAIDAAEKNDYHVVNNLLKLLQDPYKLHESENNDNIRYTKPASQQTAKIQVSCSS